MTQAIEPLSSACFSYRIQARNAQSCYTVPMRHTPFPVLFRLTALLYLSAATACALPPLWPSAMETIRVELPARSFLEDCLYPGKASVRMIEWFDHEGSRNTVFTTQPVAEISIMAGSFTPVLVYTVTPVDALPEDLVPPAGCLYPLDALIKSNRTVLRPRQNTGLSARLARRVITAASSGPEEGRRIAAAFNWRRLEREAYKMETHVWIDELRMSAAILSGRFSVREIRVPPISVVELHFDSSAPISLPDTLYSIHGEQILLTKTETHRSIVYPCTDGLHRLFFLRGWLTLIQTNGIPSLYYFTLQDLSDP